MIFEFEISTKINDVQLKLITFFLIAHVKEMKVIFK